MSINYNDMEQVKNAVSYFKKRVFDHLAHIECFIAGGAIRDYFSIGYAKGDIDVFFKNEYWYKKAFDELTIGKNCDIIHESSEAVMIKLFNCRIHLIKGHYYADQSKVITGENAFDFTVACASIDHTGNFDCHETFFVDLAAKKLVINNLPFPLSTMQRVIRYVRKDFTICNVGLLKIAKAIQTVNLDPNAYYDNPGDKKQNSFEFYPDGTLRFMRID